jgi:hypothetical protein
MFKYISALLLCLVLVAGCATTPVPVGIDALMQNPSLYRNKTVEVTGPVLSNPPPSGDLYRTWNFQIGTPELGRIMVTESGYNPATINKAYYLVDEAAKAGEPVTVTGTLRVGPYKSLKGGAEIQLRTVTYRNVTIDTSEGPYVGGYYSPYYYPYYSPFFYPYYYRSPFFWDRGFYPYGYGW